VTKEQLFIQLVEKLSSNKLFFGHAVIDAEDEAMMVMMHVFKQEVDEILTSGSTKIDDESINLAENIVSKRLTTLKPMAYILERVNFCELRFISDERALVPRSPIAELILQGFTPWIDIAKINSALDLCTGSGCIGISLAKHTKQLDVDISDISHDALSLAKENIEMHQIRTRVNVIHSDLFENITQKYDLIVTNPPYVSDAEYQELPQEYKNEPKLGLVTSQHGLTIPVQILYQAPEYMKDNGFLFLEVGYSDGALNDAFPEINIEWIDFLNGGQGVCVFSKEKLLEYRDYFKTFLKR